MEYRLLIDLEVVGQLQGLSRRVRDNLLAHFEQIRAFPTNHAAYHEYDAVGRRVEISICGRFAVHYWIDFADRHIKVLALEPAAA
ncbi:MAG: hypothetical protein L0Y58_19970 [Verrucomicrobia subdivision 3 bacterium]|nr:hypothetical protein [Limisphaerales bacterium]